MLVFGGIDEVDAKERAASSPLRRLLDGAELEHSLSARAARGADVTPDRDATAAARARSSPARAARHAGVAPDRDEPRVAATERDPHKRRVARAHEDAARRAAALRAHMPDSLLSGDHSGIFNDDEYAWLTSLSLDSWDSEFFHLLPVIVIFAAKSGANPGWLKHCKSPKMMCTTTPDGWMNEDTKFNLYKMARTAHLSPLGDPERKIVHQVDQHYSNESLEISYALERDGNIGLNTPGHHTAALQHADQRGGPIQHANRILVKLVRR